MTYLLARDFGAAGNKAALFCPDGTLAASVTATYPTYYPHDGWLERDPNDWWDAVATSTQELIRRSSIDNYGGTSVGITV